MGEVALQGGMCIHLDKRGIVCWKWDGPRQIYLASVLKEHVLGSEEGIFLEPKAARVNRRALYWVNLFHSDESFLGKTGMATLMHGLETFREVHC